MQEMCFSHVQQNQCYDLSQFIGGPRRTHSAPTYNIGCQLTPRLPFHYSWKELAMRYIYMRLKAQEMPSLV